MARGQTGTGRAVHRGSLGQQLPEAYPGPALRRRGGGDGREASGPDRRPGTRERRPQGGRRGSNDAVTEAGGSRHSGNSATWAPWERAVSVLVSTASRVRWSGWSFGNTSILTGATPSFFISS